MLPNGHDFMVSQLTYMTYPWYCGIEWQITVQTKTFGGVGNISGVGFGTNLKFFPELNNKTHLLCGRTYYP